MSDRMDAVLASIDAEITKCICGNPIPENGPSLDYCSPACQYQTMADSVGVEPDDDQWCDEDGFPLGPRRQPSELLGILRGNTRARRPVDRYTTGRASYHVPPSMAVPMRNGAQAADAAWLAATQFHWCPQITDPAAPTAAELAEGVDLSPYLVGLDADDPRHEIQAGINQMHQDLADRLGCPVAQVRSLTEYLGHQISAASDMTPGEAEEQLLRFIEASNPPEPPTPEDLRRRALEHVRNRNTGPQARRQRLPRDHRR